MGASALCGGAPNINAFIIGRALAGVGSTGMYIGLITILTVNTTNLKRPKYLSLTGFWWGIGTVFGFVVGGAFAQSSATWRWAFYLNLCISTVVAPIYLLILPNSKPLPGIPLRARLALMDYIGTVLSAKAFLCIIMAINFGSVLWNWADKRSIALFVLAGVLLVIFLFQQVYTLGTSKNHRLFPMHFLRQFEIIVLFLTISKSTTNPYPQNPFNTFQHHGINLPRSFLAVFAAFKCFISIYYLPIYFQFTRGASALKTAKYILPFILFLSACVLLNSKFMGRTKYAVPWYIWGTSLQLIGGVLMCKSFPP